jgi:ubiquinone/menaquinone biosynthesis C-methylase UbiE
VSRTFAGWTAAHYRQFRRDVPDVVMNLLVDRLGLGPDAIAVDVGAGTGQLAVPLASRAGTVLAIDPEPDMLTQLRRRSDDEGVQNLVCVLGTDRDLAVLPDVLRPDACAVVTIANALHWMDAPTVFAACRRLLRPGGAVAVVTHGTPLWLGDGEWARALRRYLESWTGQEATATCGSDDAALQHRQTELQAAGFGEVAVMKHRYQAVVDADSVIGHLYSAMPEDMVPADRRTEFETGVRLALQPFEPGSLIEDVPVTVLLGRR